MIARSRRPTRSVAARTVRKRSASAPATIVIAAFVCGATLLVGCTSSKTETTATGASSSGSTDAATTIADTTPPPVATTGVTLTLLAYDSFALSKGVLDGFTSATGIGVKVLNAGDTGEMVNKSILSKDAPLGDVMWGVDNTFLGRALDEDLFRATEIDTSVLDPALVALAPGKVVVPVDYGDVCVNYDKQALAARNVAPPDTFADLLKPEYRDMLVVQNPATSSPGLAFMLGSIAAATIGKSDAAIGRDRTWSATWEGLKANGALVVNGWSEAYEVHFSAGTGKGDRPLVVSYGSSPPAAVLFGPDPKAAESPTGVALGTCFRQVEFAGVLNGTAHAAESAQLLTFLTSTAVQEDMQLNMFVYPANTTAKPADAFVKFAAKPEQPLTLDASTIAKHRDRWIDEWSAVML